MLNSIMSHPTLWALGAWWVFSAAISSLPMPTASNSPFYTWFFGFAHTLSGSIGRVMAMKYPTQMATVTVAEQTVQPASDGTTHVTTVATTEQVKKEEVPKP